MKRRRQSGWWFWAALLAILLIVPAWQGRTLIEGRPPPLDTLSIDGAPFAWDALAGRPAVLYFWATWCPVCTAMRGNIEAVAADYPVVTVALQSGSDQELREYLHTKRFRLPVHPDPDGAIAARYGLKGVPAIFIVDARGAIRHAVTGYTTELGLRVRLWLAGLGA